jgi:uroporphyrinogen-III decarboxylase
MDAMASSIRWIAANSKLVPVGMVIGPFSLATKLLADPITAVYIAGTGVTGADDPEIALLERVMEISQAIVMRNLKAQIAAGAKLMFIAEPAGAANFISPIQMAEGSDVYQRFVVGPNLRVKAELASAGVELFLHCCGDMSPEILHELSHEIHPAILSLGPWCKLWEQAHQVPQDVVIYGNLPSKKFYSDQLVPLESVAVLTRELAQKMAETGHPFILGTECDVLSVPGAEATLKRKILAIIDA